MAIFPAELWPDILRHLVPTNCIFLSGGDPRMRWICIDKGHRGHQSIQFAIDLMTLSRNISLDCKQILYGCNTFRPRSHKSTLRLLQMLGSGNSQRLRHFEIGFDEGRRSSYDLDNASQFPMLQELARSGCFENLETFTLTDVGRGIYWYLVESQNDPLPDDQTRDLVRFDSSRWHRRYIEVIRYIIKTNPSLEDAMIYVGTDELRTTIVRAHSNMYDPDERDIAIDLDVEEQKFQKQKIPNYMRVVASW